MASSPCTSPPRRSASASCARSAARGAVAVLPGPLVARMAEAGLIGARGPRSIVALWRAPERQAHAEPWSGQANLVDVLAFGEIGLIAVRRGHGGRPVPIAPGPVTAPG